MTIDAMLQELRNSMDVRQVTYYATPDEIVRITRQGRQKLSDRSKTFLLTYGKPNYAEREFIKKAQHVGQQFPLELKLKYFPTKQLR